MGIAIGNYIMLAVQLLITVYVFKVCLRSKKIAAPIASALQTAALVLFVVLKGRNLGGESIFYVDKLSIMMLAVTVFIGIFTAVYASGDSKKKCMSVLLCTLMAACVMIFNNLLWIFVCWEIIGIICFRMVSADADGDMQKAQKAVRMLCADVFGGLGFAAGIVILGYVFGTMELGTMLMTAAVYGDLVAVAAVFLAVSAMVRMAQMPFSGWLAGMSEVSVPTAVIINTIGMMNSGAFIMIKISAVLGAGNFAGIMVMVAGGVVFLAAALIAVSQRNASKVLVWSTVSVMGLVAACAGIDSAEAVWAAVMLVMFHSVGKALLIMCVGSAVAHGAGYDIEKMTGVLAKMPKLSALMLLAMASMFMAPFGMLIAQWSALTASVDSGNLVLVAAISFGSAVTAFYWLKWMAKLMSAGKNGAKGWGELEKNERLPQMVLAVVMIMMCLTFPLISMYLLVPYVGTVYGGISSAVLTAENMIILVAMLAVLVMVFGMFFGKGMKKNVPAYMGGGADAAHTGISLKTLYFEKHLSEKRITYIAGIVTAVVIVTGVGFMIGTLVNLLGGIA